MNNKMEKQESGVEYAKKSIVEESFNIQRTIPNRKEVVIGNDKNRRKNKLECINI